MWDDKLKNKNGGNEEKNHDNDEDFNFSEESEEFQKGITPPKKDE